MKKVCSLLLCFVCSPLFGFSFTFSNVINVVQGVGSFAYAFHFFCGSYETFLQSKSDRKTIERQAALLERLSKLDSSHYASAKQKYEENLKVCAENNKYIYIFSWVL